jgi:hypothetical protein
MANNRIAWQYVASGTENYLMPALKGITDQAKAGGQAADLSETLAPRGFKPRKVVCLVTADPVKTREVICYDTVCNLWTVKGTTINLNIDDVQVACQSTDIRYEQRFPLRRRIKQTT